MSTWKPNCEFFYEDYHRGSERQECRLLARTRQAREWNIGLCRTCPVPRIRQANRCPDMILDARIESSVLGLRRHVVVAAFCTRTMKDVKDPRVGCGECHQDYLFRVSPEGD
jgi:hypothetical protein